MRTALTRAADQIVHDAHGDEEVGALARVSAITEVSVDDSLVTKVSTGVRLQVIVRAVKAGLVGIGLAASLDEKTLRSALEQARGEALRGTQDYPRERPASLPEVAVPDAAPHDEESLRAAALLLSRATTSSVDSVKATRGLTVGHGFGHTVMRDTTGLRVDYANSEVQATVAAIAQGNSASAVHMSRLNALDCVPSELERLGHEVAHKAARQLGATPLSTHLDRAVLAPWVLSALLGRVAPGFVHNGARFDAARWAVDPQLKWGGCELEDNGCLPDSPAGRPVDDEGTRPSVTVLFSKGRAAGFLAASEGAGRIGEAPTGNAAFDASGAVVTRPSTLTVRGPERSLEQQIQEMDHGCVIEALADYRNGVDPRSGKISVVVSGRLVRRGDLGESFSQGVLTCTASDLLTGMASLSADRRYIRVDALAKVSYTTVNGVLIKPA